MTAPEEMENVRGVSPFVLGVLDFFLLNVAFFSLNYWKRGTFDLIPIYVKLLFAFYGLWFIVSLSTKKFRLIEYQGLARGIWTLAWTPGKSPAINSEGVISRGRLNPTT